LFAGLETAPVLALPLHFFEIFRQNADQLVVGFEGGVDASAEPSIGQDTDLFFFMGDSPPNAFRGGVLRGLFSNPCA
jgi:hypothetical protein